jgi:transposase
LLDLLETPEAPAGLRELARMEALRRTWQRHDERTAREPAAPGAPPERRVRFQASRDLPPAAEGIASPYEVEARYRHKRDTAWTGSMVHVSETCEPTAPHLLTHVHTTPATVHEAQCTEPIQQALMEKDVPPREHLVDAASISSELLVRSRDEQDIILRGPTRPSQGWQTQVEGAYSVEQFVVDWEQQQVRCPQGQVSAKWWEHGGGQGSRPIMVELATQTCAPCPVRAACTRAKRRGRRRGLPPRAEAEAVAAARTWYASAEGKAQYGQRAGIEGTLSQGVRAFGLRRTRYWGLAKTHLQHVAIAAAINIDRMVAWLDERPRAMTRISRFAALAPANADHPGEAAA